MLYEEFLNLTGRKVSFEKYTNEIEPKYMESPLTKQEFCKEYIEKTARIRKQPTDKFEWDGYTRCQTLKTAYNRLKKILADKGYPNAMCYDEEFIDAVSKGKYVEGYYKGQYSAWEYNEYRFYEYSKNEDGIFYRFQMEHIDEDLWYIDAGFTLIN